MWTSVHLILAPWLLSSVGRETDVERSRKRTVTATLFITIFNLKRPYVKVGFIVGEVIDNAEKVPRSKVRNESDQNAKARDHKKCLKQDQLRTSLMLFLQTLFSLSSIASNVFLKTQFQDGSFKSPLAATSIVESILYQRVLL